MDPHLSSFQKAKGSPSPFTPCIGRRPFSATMPPPSVPSDGTSSDEAGTTSLSAAAHVCALDVSTLSLIYSKELRTDAAYRTVRDGGGQLCFGAFDAGVQRH